MKKALSLQAQIKRLEERGIIVQDEEKAKEILEQHLVRGQVVDKYLLHMDENM